MAQVDDPSQSADLGQEVYRKLKQEHLKRQQELLKRQQELEQEVKQLREQLKTSSKHGHEKGNGRTCK